MTFTPKELERRRTDLGLSQSEFGKAIGAGTKTKEVPQPTISSWENGTRYPNDAFSVALAIEKLEDLQNELIDEIAEALEGASVKLDSPYVNASIYTSNATFWKARPDLKDVMTASFYNTAAIRAAKYVRIDSEINVTFKEV